MGDDHKLLKVTQICLFNMCVFFEIVESATPTPDLIVMEWHCPCPLSWVCHLAHLNGLTWHLNLDNGQGFAIAYSS